MADYHKQIQDLLIDGLSKADGPEFEFWRGWGVGILHLRIDGEVYQVQWTKMREPLRAKGPQAKYRGGKTE